MGWIADVLIAALALCAVGVMLYQKLRGKEGCSGCRGCKGGDCGACAKHAPEHERREPEDG